MAVAVGDLVCDGRLQRRLPDPVPGRRRFPSADVTFWVPLILQEGGPAACCCRHFARLCPRVTLDAMVAEGPRVWSANPGAGRVRAHGRESRATERAPKEL